MVTTKILVVDDEISMVNYLRDNLEGAGYDVASATDGVEALTTFESEHPGLVIMDILMPNMDGFHLCQKLREKSRVPVIMLSGLEGEADKVKCLDLGADDYITKPFGASELLARVNSALRRIRHSRPVTRPSPLKFGDLEVDSTRRLVTHAGKEVILTPTEYAILHKLAENAGAVVTHSQLLNDVWGAGYREETQYLHVFIRRLRKKIEPDPKNPEYIATIPGVGYRFGKL